jgi:hypothetical protein
VSLTFVAAAVALLWAASHRPDLARFAALPALLLCLVAGLGIPDLDHPLPLDHRSALTHSILPALLAFARRWALPAAAGMALGISLHLAADAFPNAMTGYAMVKVPFAGSIGAGASYFWLAGNALACALLGGWLLQTQIPTLKQRAAAVAATVATGLWYLLQVDGGWWVLTLLAGAAFLAFQLRRLPA